MIKLTLKNNNAGSAYNTSLHLNKTLTIEELISMAEPKLSKECHFCKSVFYRKKSQSPSQFARQKFCSRSCGSRSTKNGAFLPGDKHWKWNGGKYTNKRGYVKIKIDGVYISEHIYISEKKIGRKLNKNEVVHHIDGITDNNAEDNLIVLDRRYHSSLHNAGKIRTEATKKLSTAISGIPDVKSFTSRGSIYDQTYGNGAPGTSRGSIYEQLPGRASGGSVYAGQAYMVGERGPEPFIPKSDGTIIPNNQMNQNSGISAVQLNQILSRMTSSIISEMAKRRI